MARVRRARGRLEDRIAPGIRILFVGINPGLRSAEVGHHFAGPSNRFWKLLFDAGLVPEPITWRDDDRLPSWGYGVTNLVARPTAGVSDLSPRELRSGRRALEGKLRRYRPRMVVLVGITVYRALFGVRGPVPIGRSSETLAGLPVFVLPNPSGRNAHFSYIEMMRAYRTLDA